MESWSQSKSCCEGSDQNVTRKEDWCRKDHMTLDGRTKRRVKVVTKKKTLRGTACAAGKPIPLHEMRGSSKKINMPITSEVQGGCGRTPMKRWDKAHWRGHDMVSREDPNGETLVRCRKCSGHAQCRLEAKLMNRYKTEKKGHERVRTNVKHSSRVRRRKCARLERKRVESRK